MFAKSKKFPISMTPRQILWPTNQSHQLEETMKLLDKGNMVFRYLGDDEELQFRTHARESYDAFSPIEGIWHPVYQDECVRINHENSFYRKPREDETSDIDEV